MDEPKQSNLTNPDLWIRLVYMILFWLLSWLARAAVGVIGLVQFVMVLLNGEASVRLRQWGVSTVLWTDQTYRFLTFASDEKPFPFQDWPEAAGPAETRAKPVVEAGPPVLETTPEAAPEEPRDSDGREP